MQSRTRFWGCEVSKSPSPQGALQPSRGVRQAEWFQRSKCSDGLLPALRELKDNQQNSAGLQGTEGQVLHPAESPRASQGRLGSGWGIERALQRRNTKAWKQTVARSTGRTKLFRVDGVYVRCEG